MMSTFSVSKGFLSVFGFCFVSTGLALEAQP